MTDNLKFDFAVSVSALTQHLRPAQNPRSPPDLDISVAHLTTPKSQAQPSQTCLSTIKNMSVKRGTLSLEKETVREFRSIPYGNM